MDKVVNSNKHHQAVVDQDKNLKNIILQHNNIPDPQGNLGDWYKVCGHHP
jgi:hypothetical protein